MMTGVKVFAAGPPPEEAAEASEFPAVFDPVYCIFVLSIPSPKMRTPWVLVM
jgi:hypothetical protein